VEFTDEAKTGENISFIYHRGAALLDLHDPTVVLARIPYPVFSPQEEYELVGDVNNVVFPCGKSTSFSIAVGEACAFSFQ
jgi:predicted GH43/DUF377 family glycosyl hydrolase